MITAATLVAFVLMFLGVVGALIPNFPDSVLIVVGAAILLLADGLTWGDGLLFAAVLLIALAAEGVVYLTQAYGVKKAGSSWRGVVGALIGGLVGIFVLQPFGILIGPIVGATLGELLGGKKGKEAMRAGFGALLGSLGGIVLKFTSAVMMVGLVLIVQYL